jgi:acyl carrier protein
MRDDASQADIDGARLLVAEAMERPVGDVPADGSMDTLPGWDSLAHVRIILAIEDRTGRPLDSEIIGELRSVADVADALRQS